MELQQVLQEKYYKSSTQIGSLTETKINSVNCLDLFVIGYIVLLCN